MKRNPDTKAHSRTPVPLASSIPPPHASVCAQPQRHLRAKPEEGDPSIQKRYWGPVFPILPSFFDSGELDLGHTASYVRFLEKSGARTIVTTAGSSQFNLLSTDEILLLNALAGDAFSGRVILGAPPLAEFHLAPFLDAMLERHSNASLLLIYPERYYEACDVVGFFERVARSHPNRLFLHGLPMRSARGGVDDYTGSLIAEIIAAVPNVAGMKEESTSYEAGFTLCAELAAHRDFEVIVAGGTMRRFLLLHAAGAQSFFAGVGSLFPAVELAYARYIAEGSLGEARAIIAEIETPLFRVFMEVGWHKALRHAAKHMNLIGPGERRPMASVNEREKDRIEGVLLAVEEKVRLLRQEGLV